MQFLFCWGCRRLMSALSSKLHFANHCLLGSQGLGAPPIAHERESHWPLNVGWAGAGFDCDSTQLAHPPAAIPTPSAAAQSGALSPTADGRGGAPLPPGPSTGGAGGASPPKIGASCPCHASPGGHPLPEGSFQRAWGEVKGSHCETSTLHCC
jgi:hypothetical protein